MSGLRVFKKVICWPYILYTCDFGTLLQPQPFHCLACAIFELFPSMGTWVMVPTHCVGHFQKETSPTDLGSIVSLHLPFQIPKPNGYVSLCLDKSWAPIPPAGGLYRGGELSPCFSSCSLESLELWDSPRWENNKICFNILCGWFWETFCQKFGRSFREKLGEILD